MEYQAKNTEANIYQRIASGGEQTVNSALSILDEYGLQQPVTRKDLAKALLEAVANYGDPAYRKIIEIHPDRAAIISNIAPALNDTGHHHNDCGCHKNDVGAVGAGIQVSDKAQMGSEVSTVNSKFEIQHYAMILVLTIGSITFFSLLISQTLSHMKSSK